MKNVTNCPLCSSNSPFFLEDRRTSFYKCSGCGSIFRDPADDLPFEQEKARYLTHNNCPVDPGYCAFVAPIIGEVKKLFLPSHQGLDFGAGPVPVIAKLLQNQGYQLEAYDPFFHDRPELLQEKYDFITACEVIEHFRDPAGEFERLRSMLKPEGVLLCMTLLYEDKIDFARWHYKNDRTHRFFYSRQALEWVKERMGFASLKIQGRLVTYS
jgi:SAM-dependent methyltransferase